MMRGEYKQPNIFSRSFLDVLCCTVGALIFILFIQTLRTRDRVERRELEKTTTKLDEAKAELAGTEDAQKRLQGDFRQLQEDYKQVQDDIAAAKQEKVQMENDLKAVMVRLEEPRAAAKKEKEELESELAAAMKR